MDPTSLPPLSDREGQIQHLREDLFAQQLELEQQNRELVDLHRHLEASHNRYLDLYQFAPILYATFNRMGMTLDINLKGVQLLGVPMHQVLQHRFSRFVSSSNWSAFVTH